MKKEYVKYERETLYFQKLDYFFADIPKWQNETI